MSIELAEFQADGATYYLRHYKEDDSRKVETPEGDVVVTIDRNLVFHRGGGMIGKINQNVIGHFCFSSSRSDFLSFDTNHTYVGSYVNLICAEIEIATKLIEHIGRNAQPEIVWSCDGEWFGCDSVEELISDYIGSEDLSPGTTVFYGDKADIEPTDLVRAMHIIDQANQALGDLLEDPNYLEPSLEAQQELDDLITAWFKKHCPINYYRVENVKEHVLTEQDFINAGEETGENQ